MNIVATERDGNELHREVKISVNFAKTPWVFP